MKYLVYGEYWAGTLPDMLVKELRKRNYEVSIFDYTTIVPGISSRKLFGRIKRRLFSCFYDYRVNIELIDYASRLQPDVILISKGLNVQVKTLLNLRSKISGVKIVNWNPDEFFNPKNSNENLLKCFSSYDLLISSRPHLFDEYRQKGAQNLAFIDWYYIPELHHVRNVSLKYDVTFVGNWSPNREAFISKIGLAVSIWGGGWERSSRKFRSDHAVNIGMVTQEEMSTIFAASKFNLNMLTAENRDFSNLRLFEVCASGGLLVTERNESTMSYLEDGVDCLMYDFPCDVKALVNSDNDFRLIASKGHERILGGGYSFSDRVTLFIDKLSKISTTT